MRNLLVLLLASCTACTTAAPQSGNTAAQGQSDALARIRALIAAPACSSDSQCHTLAIGQRACGGPESYLAWSSAKTPQAEIEALGERYREERRAANAAGGMLSTCQFMPDPGAVCRAGTCQLGGNGAPQAR